LVSDAEEGLENGDGWRIDVKKGWRGYENVALILSENMPANHFGKLTIHYEAEKWPWKSDRDERSEIYLLTGSNGRPRGEKNLVNSGIDLFPHVGRGNEDVPVKLTVGLDPALGHFKGMQPKQTEPVGSSRPSKAVFETKYIELYSKRLSVYFGQE
jgi:hypothetical protein